MKVLTINGSPRVKGCSGVLLNQIVKGAKENEKEVVSFHPNKMDIVGCQACMSCRTTKKCAIKDDMTKIYKEIDESDIVVFSAPIYFHEVTAQLKTVIDRLYPYSHMDENFNFSTTMKKGKKCIVVVPYGNHSKTVYEAYTKSLKERFEFLGFEKVETFIASDSMSENPQYLEACYNIGLNL